MMRQPTFHAVYANMLTRNCVRVPAHAKVCLSNDKQHCCLDSYRSYKQNIIGNLVFLDNQFKLNRMQMFNASIATELISIVARRDGWVRALGGARASVRGPTTGFVDVVKV